MSLTSENIKRFVNMKKMEDNVKDYSDEILEID